MEYPVQDIDFARSEIALRDGKGAKDGVAMLPASQKKLLEHHLGTVQAIHEKDQSEGRGITPGLHNPGLDPGAEGWGRLKARACVQCLTGPGSAPTFLFSA
jgi:hypothetical protein